MDVNKTKAISIKIESVIYFQNVCIDSELTIGAASPVDLQWISRAFIRCSVPSPKSRLPTGEPQEPGALGKLIAITQFGPKPF